MFPMVAERKSITLSRFGGEVFVILPFLALVLVSICRRLAAFGDVWPGR